MKFIQHSSLHLNIMVLWGLLLAPLPSLNAADLKLASVFSEHMVLQRDKPVPIWGWANAGEKVVVEFAGQTKAATAEASGKWLAKLDPMPASAEPRTLKVNGIVIEDVLVGEVWLASGQSNMGYRLSPDYDAAAIAASDHPELRFFSEESEGSLTPQADAKGQWQVSSPKTAPGFTAVGYYFAERLRRELKVPVGIVRSSVGGTQGESWLSREAQVASPLLKNYCENQINAMTTSRKTQVYLTKLSRNGRSRMRPEIRATPVLQRAGPTRILTIPIGRPVRLRFPGGKSGSKAVASFGCARPWTFPPTRRAKALATPSMGMMSISPRPISMEWN